MRMPETSYDFYYGAHCGGRQGCLTKEEFDGLVKEATAQVGDYITYDGDYPPFEDQIRGCICRVAEELHRSGGYRHIKSENTDGYSVTYRDDVRTDSQIRRIVASALDGTGLIYKGVEL